VARVLLPPNSSRGRFPVKVNVWFATEAEISESKLLFSGFGVNWFYPVKVLPPQKAAQQGIAPDCLTLGFLEMVRQQKCLWLRRVLLARQPVNASVRWLFVPIITLA